MNDQITSCPKIKLLLSPLDGIAEKDRYLNRTTGWIDESCPAEREQISDTCERDGDGMKVHPVHVLGDTFQNVRKRLGCGLGRRDVLTNRVKEECAGTAGCVQNAHCERRCDSLVDHFFCEPVGCVVFPELFTCRRADDGLIQHLQYVLFDRLPIKATKAARKRPHKFLAAVDLQNPVEEIRFDDTVNAALVE